MVVACKRSLQDLDIRLCQLSLLLQPCYGGVFHQGADCLRSLMLKAIEVMQMRGCSSEQAERLMNEMLLYIARGQVAAGQQYSIACTRRTSAKPWWRLLSNSSDNPLVTLALLLLSICPWASERERVFSLRGQCPSQRPGAVDGNLLRPLQAVRVHLHSKRKAPDAAATAAKPKKGKAPVAVGPGGSGQGAVSLWDAYVGGHDSLLGSVPGSSSFSDAALPPNLSLLARRMEQDDLEPAQLTSQLEEMYAECLRGYEGDPTLGDLPTPEALLSIWDGINLNSNIFRDLDAGFAQDVAAEVVNPSQRVRAPTSDQFSAEDIVTRLGR
eukprot:jgi/Botrbrau1/3343/Bobra.0048s0038.1